VGRWQADVVVRLRALRRSLKHGWEGHPAAERARVLRRQVAALELEAERTEQALLHALSLGWPAPRRPRSPVRAIRANLERCIAGAHRNDEFVAAALATLAAAFRATSAGSPGGKDG
jgi:hypothetical protein